MREILFRGKQKDNDEWIYGSLVDTREVYACSQHCFIVDNDYDDHEEFEVEPATVGQYTGLTDKNGKKIFGGDIVRTKEYGKQIGQVNVKDFDVFRVVYSPCAFRIERDNPERGFALVGDICGKIEVIGNIYDNPELLEELT